TLNSIPEIRVRSALVNVVLPAPEGEETISSRGELFDILNLFAESFEFGFEFYDQVRRFGVGTLRANRVRFATQFLREEIEASAHRLWVGTQVCELSEVAVQTCQLLGDIRPLCEQRHFEFETRRIELSRTTQRQKLRYALAQTFTVVGHQLRAALLDLCTQHA